MKIPQGTIGMAGACARKATKIAAFRKKSLSELRRKDAPYLDSRPMAIKMRFYYGHSYLDQANKMSNSFAR